MKIKMTKDEQKLKLLSLLKHFYADLHTEAKTFSLAKVCNEWGFGNPNVIAIKLVELGYIIKTGSSMNVRYIWNKNFDPTLTEAERILEAVSEYSRNAYKKQDNIAFPKRDKEDLESGISPKEKDHKRNMHKLPEITDPETIKFLDERVCIINEENNHKIAELISPKKEKISEEIKPEIKPEVHSETESIISLNNLNTHIVAINSYCEKNNLKFELKFFKP